MEKHLEAKLRDQVKAKGGIAYKFTAPGIRGVPDRIVCMPDNGHVFVELKYGKNGLSSDQIREQKRLRSLGHRVENIKTNEELKQFLETI